jgi:hypothetical protein
MRSGVVTGGDVLEHLLRHVLGREQVEEVLPVACAVASEISSQETVVCVNNRAT